MVVKQELLLVIIGGVFALEALSVIAQVGFFKLSGGSGCCAAPLQHHFICRHAGPAHRRALLDPGRCFAGLGMASLAVG